MKLWLIARTDTIGYDDYDSAVVAAETEEAARVTHPAGVAVWQNEKWDRPDGGYYYGGDWAAPATLTVTLVGEAVEGTPPGVILASFNAG